MQLVAHLQKIKAWENHSWLYLALLPAGLGARLSGEAAQQQPLAYACLLADVVEDLSDWLRPTPARVLRINWKRSNKGVFELASFDSIRGLN